MTSDDHGPEISPLGDETEPEPYFTYIRARLRQPVKCLNRKARRGVQVDPYVHHRTMRPDYAQPPTCPRPQASPAAPKTEDAPCSLVVSAETSEAAKHRRRMGVRETRAAAPEGPQSGPETRSRQHFAPHLAPPLPTDASAQAVCGPTPHTEPSPSAPRGGKLAGWCVPSTSQNKLWGQNCTQKSCAGSSRRRQTM